MFSLLLIDLLMIAFAFDHQTLITRKIREKCLKIMKTKRVELCEDFSRAYDELRYQPSVCFSTRFFPSVWTLQINSSSTLDKSLIH
jgi:hypothetical protein